MKKTTLKPKILFTEDNEMMQALLESYFQEKYDVITKENGLSALSWLEAGNTPDLIISDIEMPDLDGFELLKIIRSSSFYNKIPMFILSGKQKSQDRITAYRLGANDFLTKPFNPEELSIKIENLLNK
jgi:DNA-binding response OmpR family regulator